MSVKDLEDLLDLVKSAIENDFQSAIDAINTEKGAQPGEPLYLEPPQEIFIGARFYDLKIENGKPTVVIEPLSPDKIEISDDGNWWEFAGRLAVRLELRAPDQDILARKLLRYGRALRKVLRDNFAVEVDDRKAVKALFVRRGVIAQGKYGSTFAGEVAYEIEANFVEE